MVNSRQLLEARNLGRRHPKTDQWLLRGISCRLNPGDRLAVIGPSGSGKSLLLRGLALLDPLDEGQVLWNGKSVHGSAVPAFRSQVIYLHQRPALVEGTVEHNLRQPLRMQEHRDRSFNSRRIGNLLRQLGRDDLFLAKQQQILSGGEAQLVALLRAVQLDPCILLLDEPTAALDRTTAEAVEQLVDRWLRDRPDVRAAVWVSHDRQQAQRVSTRRLYLRRGRMEKED